MTRDPSEENGGSNLYAFVRNDSINVIDPFGLQSYGYGGEHGWKAMSRDLSATNKGTVGKESAFCGWLSNKIRGYCPSSKDKRAWDRFVSKTEQDIILTGEEVEDIVNRSKLYTNYINGILRKCEEGGSWSDRVKVIGRNELNPEGPWSVAIGTLHETKITSSCECKCMNFEVEIEDDFDFNIFALRKFSAQIKTMMVRTSQALCGWKDFTHRGSASINKGQGCNK